MRVSSTIILSLAAALAPGAARAPAQGSGAASAAAVASDIARRAQPVERSVTLHAGAITVDSALHAIARQGGVTLLYSEYVVPVGRHVRVELDGATVADALSAVLRGTGVRSRLAPGGQIMLEPAPPPHRPAPGDSRADGTVTGRVTDAKTGAPVGGASVVVAGLGRGASAGEDGRYRIGDVPGGVHTLTARRIGYEPSSRSVAVAADSVVTADFALQPAASVLDQVVVTGTIVPTERKALPTPISVITDSTIERLQLAHVDEIFRGIVPGSIAWAVPATDYYSSINVRGASSLGVNMVKTYIDGVEISDPMSIANVDPSIIDHIELTRGPQASTIYGSDAAGGVLQIFTKRGLMGASKPLVNAKLSAGVISGTGTRSTAARQDHALSVAGGSANVGYTLGASYRTIGEWVPAYGARSTGFDVGVNAAQGPLSVATFARFQAKTYDAAWDPDLRAAGYLNFSKPPDTRFNVRQQTYGVRLGLASTPWWHHEVTLGYDRNFLGFASTGPKLTTPADTFLTASSSETEKGSLRYNTTMQGSLGARVSGELTAGVEYYEYALISSYTFRATKTSGSLDGLSLPVRTPYTNSGFFAQAQLGVRDRLFFTGGIRGERNENFGERFGTAWSPRVGVSYAQRVGGASVKGRVSYGEAIRAPFPTEKEADYSPFYTQLAAPELGPERQSGWDAGVEVYLAEVLSLSASYYDQTAKDLIDNVLVAAAADSTPPSYQFQNTGRIQNTGWEFEARLSLNRLQLGGTLSFARSIVRRLDSTYAGDYRVGDEVLGVPRSTAGATAAFAPRSGTRLTARVTHVGSWRQLDLLALYGAIYGSDPFRGSYRAYRMSYPAFTKYDLGVTQGITPHATAYVQVDNVSGVRPYEYSNLNIPMGRSATFGVRLAF